MSPSTIMRPEEDGEAPGSRGERARIRFTRLARHVVERHDDDGDDVVVDNGSPSTSSSSWIAETNRLPGRLGERVVVVGGSVLDVHLTSDAVVPGSTVPGRVAFRHGGVGRNIVECLGRLRERPLFVSAVGNDAAGREILRALRSLDLSTRGVRVCDGLATSVVACSFDGGGNLTSGVADTSLVESELTRDWVGRFREDIEGAKLLVVEANLTHAILELCFDVAHAAGVPVFFEPVSVTKSLRVLPFLDRTTFLSPNEAELGAISAAARGPDAGAIEEKAAFLRSKGVAHVLVTMGKAGVYAATRGGDGEDLCERFPSLEVAVANVNGAGDCLVAGVIRALVKTDPLGSIPYAVSYGIAVACVAIQTTMNVPAITGEDEIDANALQVFTNRRSA